MAASTAKMVDFSNVKDGGNFNKRRIPAGDYLAKIVKVEDAEAKDKTFQYLFSIKIQKHPSSVLPYYCKLQENQLWKLRNILIAGGLTVPKKKQKVDVNKLVNRLIGVTIEDAEYQDKEQSEIAGVFPAAELGDDVDSTPVDDDDDSDEGEGEEVGEIDEAYDTLEDDEAEVAEEPEDEAEEAEEEPEADPYADLDRVALKAELKKRDPKFVAKKSQTDDDLRALLVAGDAPAGEDEEEAPAPVKKTAKKKAAEVTDDELEEIDIDDL